MKTRRAVDAADTALLSATQIIRQASASDGLKALTPNEVAAALKSIGNILEPKSVQLITSKLTADADDDNALVTDGLPKLETAFAKRDGLKMIPHIVLRMAAKTGDASTA